MDRFYDNTRITSHKSCPRKFFFRHHLDLIKDAPKSPALIFGGAWHDAMDAVWKELWDNSDADIGEVVSRASDAFNEKWVEEGLTPWDEMGSEEMDALGARTPMTAKEMLYYYVEERRSLFQNPSFKLLAIEQPFAVPLDPEDDTLHYVGRLDKIFELNGDIIIGEHKTTSLYAKNGPFRTQFIDSFSPNSQIDGYLFAANMLYKKVKSCWIDAALVHKTVHDGFRFIPIERRTAMLDGWLWEVRSWIDSIEGNYNLIGSTCPNDKYMSAFPKNTNSCFEYNTQCGYADLCRFTPNPIGRNDFPGYKTEKWSPFDELKLSTIGVKK